MLPSTEGPGQVVPETSTFQRPTTPQMVLSVIFDASTLAVGSLAVHVPDLDRDRCEYALASVLLEEAWVAQR